MIESIPENTPDGEIPEALRSLFHVKQRDEIDRGTTLFDHIAMTFCSF